METKKCSKCGESKKISEFGKRKANKDGFSYNCKNCEKEYRTLNSEKIKERTKKWRNENSEKHKDYCKNWRKENSEKVKLLRLKWINENPEKHKQQSRKRMKKYYKLNIEKIKEKKDLKKWVKINNINN